MKRTRSGRSIRLGGGPYFDGVSVSSAGLVDRPCQAQQDRWHLMLTEVVLVASDMHYSAYIESACGNCGCHVVSARGVLLPHAWLGYFSMGI